jgi:hypothetical protein
MSWIMPLLKRAAPKWKQILMEIGMPNDYITTLATCRRDEVILLDMGVSNWLRQQAPQGATLADLVKALCSPEVSVGDVATDIVMGNSTEGMWLSVFIVPSVP